MLMLLTVVACKDDEVDASCKESRLLYQSISGNIKLTTEYEYDSLDRIKRISRKRSTPGTTQGVDYDYNTDGQLEKVETYRGEGGVGFIRTDSIGLTLILTNNLYKMLKYTGDNSGLMTLLSTQTVPEYFSSPNPVATLEILPIAKFQ